jgi:adenine phosphoribosyltransferase
MDLKQYIRDIPDFPEPGILFRDITPLLRNHQAFTYTIDRLIERYKDDSVDTVVAVESRGFLFGAPLAYKMGKSFVPVRKKGKLPAATHTAEYSLEYGANIMEIHTGDISNGERVLILDDLLATGGTLEATARLVELSGGTVAGIGLVIELTDLGGRQRLSNYDVFSLVQY